LDPLGVASSYLHYRRGSGEVNRRSRPTNHELDGSSRTNLPVNFRAAAPISRLPMAFRPAKVCQQTTAATNYGSNMRVVSVAAGTVAKRRATARTAAIALGVAPKTKTLCHGTT